MKRDVERSDEEAYEALSTERSKRSEKRRAEVTGSRWVALALLMITVLLSFLFYLRGRFRGLTLEFPGMSSSWEFQR